MAAFAPAIAVKRQEPGVGAGKMGDTKKDPRTLFVRNISFDVADEKPLEELFSDVGPIKSAFLVRDKGATKHKGFGFVTYALQEDADRAAAELNGKPLAGRKLQVSRAMHGAH